jgi:hypothetical protein
MLEQLLNAKKAAVEKYMKASNPAVRDPTADERNGNLTGFAWNVVGVGIGPKMTTGQPPGDPCVRIYVARKIGDGKNCDDKRIPPAFFIDPEIKVGSSGVKAKVEKAKTDVIEAPPFSSLPPSAVAGQKIGLGYNAPNIDQPSIGTFAAIVTATNGGEATYYALGANHVMAANGLIPANMPLVCARYDQFMDPSEQVFAETTLHVWMQSSIPNVVDCALARLNRQKSMGVPKRIAKPTLNMKVVRSDESSPIIGTVVDVDAYLRMDYSFGTFDLEHQLLIESDDPSKAYARPGDSGALLVDDKETGDAIAMVVGGFGKYTIASPLTNVIEALREQLKNEPQMSDVRLELRAVAPAEEALSTAAG